MKARLVVLGCIWGSTAFAAPDWRAMTQKCVSLVTDEEVAKCLRAGAKAQDEQEQAENDKKVEAVKTELDRPVRLLVRDTASSISNFAGKGLGEKGASLSVQRDKGEDSTQAKIALFGVFQPLLGGRVQPFVGVAVSRDGAADPKKDIRQLTAGTAGPLFQTTGPGYESFTLIHTLQASRRYDKYGTTDGDTTRVHFDLAWAPLANGDLLGGLAVLPHIAALWQRRTDGGVENGNWRSVYIGAQLEKPFELGTHKFKASAAARRLFDTSVPTGNAERSANSFNLSLDYYFYDPDNKMARLQPSLFVTRETGTDFLEYGKAVNKTTAGFRLKFN